MELTQEQISSFVDALVNAPDLAKSYAHDCPALLKARWGPFGTSVLHFLAIEDFQSGVRCAHELGCDLNVTDKFGGTALTDAVRMENLEMVQLLLEIEADPTIVTPIGTALDLAELMSNAEIADLVKSHGGTHEFEPDAEE